VTQDVGDGGAEGGQVVQGLLGDLVIAVGLTDGQGQAEGEAGGAPPGLAHALLGGERGRRLGETVEVGEVTVLDAAGVSIGEPTAWTKQQELAGDGRRADPWIVDGFGGGDPQLFEQGQSLNSQAQHPVCPAPHEMATCRFRDPSVTARCQAARTALKLKPPGR
jgi:hypothetical protein